MTMNPALKIFVPTAQMITALLHPYAEVVIHDLKNNKIAAIFNSFSKRKVGDESVLDEHDQAYKANDTWGPFEKTNWNGAQLKSVCSIIRNNVDKAIGLLCINLDISKFKELQNVIDSFLNQNLLKPQPKILFKDDWQEKINTYLQNFLHINHLSMSNLSREQKQKLVETLYHDGAFKAKNAANYVANILDISPATVYKYLNSITTFKK